MTEWEIRKQIKNGTVDWHWISCHQVLSGDFIREFQDEVRWDYISHYQVLSENFIREFKGKVDWDRISYNQVLSQNFIREFQNKVDWDWISYKQVLSEDFIREFKDKVYWDWMSYNYKIPLSTKLLFYREYNLISINPEIKNIIIEMQEYFRDKNPSREEIESYIIMESLVK